MSTILRVDGHWFIDASNRRCLLRGVNLGGSSKIPSRPNGATHIPTDNGGHRQVSFIDRPFPIREADEHFRRLKHWGFNCLRFLTTWEAVEHSGPGEYDEPYLDYLYEVVRKAGDYGFYVFIDPHQDVWSRMSGGDGAPGWTLELAGFNLKQLDASEAAITMPARYPNYDSKFWHLNAGRLACATMFTLFFAGQQFAPELQVDGENIQPYLQRHFIAAMVQVAERMAGLSHVIGYDSLNEPNPGYIGLEDLNATQVMWANGPLVTPFEGMFIPAGITYNVPWIEFDGLQPSQTREVILNEGCISAWTDPGRDIWRNHEVWDLDSSGRPALLRPDAFAGVSFFADCLKPFIRRYAAAIRQAHPGAIIFIEGQPGSLEPLRIGDGIPVVNASHWYDVLTLHTKHYDPRQTLEWGTFRMIEGEREVRELFANQIQLIVEMSRTHLDGAPTLIGEFGVPMDLDGGQAYRSGDYSEQSAALSAYYDALDEHLVHATQWNYTADNDHRWGDQWNQEDLSLFSPDDQADRTNPDDGGRGVEGFCRPHIVACAGTPLRQSFDRQSGNFTLEVEVDTAIHAPTLVYMPNIQYPQGCRVWASDGEVEYNRSSQQITWQHRKAGKQTLQLSRQ